MTKKVGADERNSASQESVKKIQAIRKVLVLGPHANSHIQWYFENVRQQLHRKITSHLKFGNKEGVHVCWRCAEEEEEGRGRQGGEVHVLSRSTATLEVWGL
jgi:hypothetical protein